MVQDFSALSTEFAQTAWDFEPGDIPDPPDISGHTLLDGDTITCAQGDVEGIILSHEYFADDATLTNPDRTREEILADAGALDAYFPTAETETNVTDSTKAGLWARFFRHQTLPTTVVASNNTDIEINPAFHWVTREKPDGSASHITLMQGETAVAELDSVDDLFRLSPDEIQTLTDNDTDGFCHLISQLRDSDANRYIVDAALANNQNIGEMYFGYLEHQEDGLALADAS